MKATTSLSLMEWVDQIPARQILISHRYHLIVSGKNSKITFGNRSKSILPAMPMFFGSTRMAQGLVIVGFVVKPTPTKHLVSVSTAKLHPLTRPQTSLLPRAGEVSTLEWPLLGKPIFVPKPLSGREDQKQVCEKGTSLMEITYIS